MIPIRPDIAFVALASCFGFLFLLFTPPGQAPDDPEHFFRAYQVATGNWIATHEDSMVGGQLPRDLAVIHKAVARGIFDRRQNPDDILRMIDFKRSPVQAESTMFTGFPNTALNSPLLYMPQAVGINIGRALHASPIALHYLCRATNLLIWILVVFLAIKVLPMAKWLMLILALTPISLFLASSVSADALTYGLSFLFIAVVMNLSYGNADLNLKVSLLLLTLCVLIALSKFVYTALVPLVLLLPRSKFRSNRHRLLFIALCFSLAGITSLLWSKLALDLYQPASAGQTPDPSAQIGFILSKPLDYLSIFYASLMDRLGNIARQLIGKLGWLDTPLPIWFHVLSYLMIALVSLLDQTSEIRLSLYSKFLILFVLIVGTMLIFTGLYIKWTSIGADLIMGVQGRYFIPFFFLFWLLFYRVGILEARVSSYHLGFSTLIYCAVMLSYISWLLLNRYYTV